MTTVPTYNVQGTNGQVVQHHQDRQLADRIERWHAGLHADGPEPATLPNSGNAGANFTIGGAIDIVPATVDGVYTGNINVTVDY